MSALDSDRASAHTAGYGCFYKSLALLILFTLACCGGATIWISMQRQHYRQQLNTALEQIRVLGEPVDGADLNAFYAVPPGEKDRTALYLQALKHFEGGSSYAADPERVRILEAMTKTPPAPPGKIGPTCRRPQGCLKLMRRHWQLCTTPAVKTGPYVTRSIARRD